MLCEIVNVLAIIIGKKQLKKYQVKLNIRTKKTGSEKGEGFQ